jgi:hypothetical protein
MFEGTAIELKQQQWLFVSKFTGTPEDTTDRATGAVGNC